MLQIELCKENDPQKPKHLLLLNPKQPLPYNNKFFMIKHSICDNSSTTFKSMGAS